MDRVLVVGEEDDDVVLKVNSGPRSSDNISATSASTPTLRRLVRSINRWQIILYKLVTYHT